MKPKILLRLGALFMFLHAIGHTFGALTWARTKDVRMAKVVNAMLSEHFAFMGVSPSLGQFYTGYGITLIFVLVFLSALLWILSVHFVRQIVMLTGAFLLCLVVCEYVYFFPFAALFTLIAAVCTLLSVVNRSKTTFS